jgi:hypothetical protein
MEALNLNVAMTVTTNRTRQCSRTLTATALADAIHIREQHPPSQIVAWNLWTQTHQAMVEHIHSSAAISVGASSHTISTVLSTAVLVGVELLTAARRRDGVGRGVPRSNNMNQIRKQWVYTVYSLVDILRAFPQTSCEELQSILRVTKSKYHEPQ